MGYHRVPDRPRTDTGTALARSQNASRAPMNSRSSGPENPTAAPNRASP